MKTTMLAAALVAGLGMGATAPVAQAQVGIELGEGGVRLRVPGRGVSEREAIAVARDNGVVDVSRVVRSGDQWRVIGEDRRGNEIRVFVDADNGRVIRVVRAASREISEREAIGIARDNGLDGRPERVVRTGDEWRVSGEDRRGRRIRVIIDAESGDVIRTVRG